MNDIAARKRIAKRRAHDRANGITAHVDATPARRHIEHLLEAGMPLPTIAATAGTTRQTLRNILDGQNTILREREAAILSVTASAIYRATDTGLLSAEGARRRIRSLMALGWTAVDIAAASGRPDSTCQVQQTAAIRQWVKPSTHARIDRAWKALGMKPGPSAINRHRARLAGWPPPLAWDNIDDPAENPKVTVDSDRETARDEDIAWLFEMGLSADEVADRLGMHPHSLRDRLRRNRAA